MTFDQTIVVVSFSNSYKMMLNKSKEIVNGTAEELEWLALSQAHTQGNAL